MMLVDRPEPMPETDTDDDGARPIVPVVAVACDPSWRAILEAEGFGVTWYDTPEEALVAVDRTQPAALVTGVFDNPTLRRRWAVTVRTLDHLRRTPWVVVADAANDSLLDALEAGADDFVLASTESGLFSVRLRALLRLIERLRLARETGGRARRGEIGPAGTLALIKLCETHRITGRLSVDSEGRQLWVTFQKGELLGAGPEEDADPLDAFLAVQRGSYTIEEVELDLDAAANGVGPRPVDTPRAGGEASEEADVVAMPTGRLSRVEYQGRSYQVQTEGHNQPNFTITTIVDQDGQTVRKVENAWPHPLRRRSDYDLARTEIDRQHDRVTRRMREMSADERGAAEETSSSSPGRVTGTLLTWAAYFVTEHICSQLGVVVTESILRRAFNVTAASHPSLSAFRIDSGARVELDTSAVHLIRSSEEAVLGVCEWLSRVLDDAGRLEHEAGHLSIRPATVLMEGPLEKIGFYAMFENARRTAA